MWTVYVRLDQIIHLFLMRGFCPLVVLSSRNVLDLKGNPAKLYWVP